MLLIEHLNLNVSGIPVLEWWGVGLLVCWFAGLPDVPQNDRRPSLRCHFTTCTTYCRSNGQVALDFYEAPIRGCGNWCDAGSFLAPEHCTSQIIRKMFLF